MTVARTIRYHLIALTVLLVVAVGYPAGAQTCPDGWADTSVSETLQFCHHPDYGSVSASNAWAIDDGTIADYDRRHRYKPYGRGTTIAPTANGNQALHGFGPDAEHWKDAELRHRCENGTVGYEAYC